MARSKRPSTRRSNSDELLEQDDAPSPKKRSSQSKKPVVVDYKAILTWINSAGLVILFIFFIIYVFTRPMATEPTNVTRDTVTASRDSYLVKEVPFTLVMDEGSLSMNLSLKLIQVDFANLLYYDLCCMLRKPVESFVCRTSTKSLGVDAYMTDKSVIIQVSNQNLIGSSCRLTYMERRKV